MDLGGLHVIDAGAGSPVVLVHGAMDRASGLAKVARHLRGHRVVRYDRRGYAKSFALGPGSLDDHIADLVGLASRLAGQGPSPVVVGHSFGGLVALGAARRVPTVISGAGAFEPPTVWHHLWPGGIERFDGDPARAVDMVVEHAVGADRWRRAPAAMREARRREGSALLREMQSLVGTGPPAAIGPTLIPTSLAYGSASRPHVEAGLLDLAATMGLDSLTRIDGPAHRAPVTHASEMAGWVSSLMHRADRHANLTPSPP